jgi:hypothetical protein
VLRRWLVRAGIWSLIVVGGGAVNVAVEGGTKGVLLAAGALAMDVGVTMAHEDLKRARRTDHG